LPLSATGTTHCPGRSVITTHTVPALDDLWSRRPSVSVTGACRHCT